MNKREETIKKVMELWDKYPDWRLGQLLCNVATWSRGPDKSTVWDVTNNEIIDAINSHLSKEE
jgi:hypothetical protein